MVAPDASLELPFNALSLGGTSMDFGTIGATTLAESGTLVIANDASLAAPVLLGTGALLDFTGTLAADGAATLGYEEAISLDASAVLTGDCTLLAGNFSEAGLITGPGTLLAGSGETLLISAGSVGGGTDLEVAAGGVMLLGPVAPLYGVFDATVLTLDNSVTLSFANNAGVAGVSGIYADTLGGTGGAFVINGPQAFSGTILGFAPGDQLIFPGLSDFSVYNVGSSSFSVAGLDGTGATDTYVIYASMAPGTTLIAGQDAEGDPDVMLRPAATATDFPSDLVFEASVWRRAAVAGADPGADSGHHAKHEPHFGGSAWRAEGRHARPRHNHYPQRHGRKRDECRAGRADLYGDGPCRHAHARQQYQHFGRADGVCRDRDGNAWDAQRLFWKFVQRSAGGFLWCEWRVFAGDGRDRSG
jgi:hypothetical protein